MGGHGDFTGWHKLLPYPTVLRIHSANGSDHKAYLRCGMWGHLSSGVIQENSQKKRNKNKTTRGQLQKLPKMFLTWSESSVTRSPSFVIPSSFRSFRWGQRARQNALATCSVSLLWSAGSLRQLCWSSFSRKNTYPQTKEAFTLCRGYGTSRLATVFEHPVL